MQQSTACWSVAASRAHQKVRGKCFSENRIRSKSTLQEVERAEGEGGEEQESFGGVLKRRQRAAEAGEVGTGVGADPESTQTLLDAYFGSDEAQLGEDDRFLKRFIASKARSMPLLDVPLHLRDCGSN